MSKHSKISAERSLAIFSYAFYLIFFFLSEQLRWEALGQKWFRENENKHPHDSFCWYDGKLVNKWSEQAGRFWLCSAKVHKFWEGHKNMTKSPNFFWQNGLLSKFFSKFFDFLKKWAAADKPCPQLQPTLLRRPFCQNFFGDFVIFLWPSQNIWTLLYSCKPGLLGDSV